MKRRHFLLMLTALPLMLATMSCGYLGPEDVPSTVLASKQVGPWQRGGTGAGNATHQIWERQER